jgi:hypothetical protein
VFIIERAHEDHEANTPTKPSVPTVYCCVGKCRGVPVYLPASLRGPWSRLAGGWWEAEEEKKRRKRREEREVFMPGQ